MSFEAWRAQAPKLGKLVRGIQWVLAAWILHGERAYGERYAQAVSETGLAPQTVLNILAVARAFPPARQREALSFSHHEAVAALDPEAQDAYLDAAVEAQWSVTRLRAALRAAHNGVGAPPAPVPLAEIGDRLAAAALGIATDAIDLEISPSNADFGALRDLAHDWQRRRRG
jgi:hypothetical protein